MGTHHRHPLRVGQVRSCPRITDRYVRVEGLVHDGRRITDVVVLDSRDGSEVTLDADMVVSWPLMPKGSVTFPPRKANADEDVLLGDVRRDPDPRGPRREVEVVGLVDSDPPKAVVVSSTTGRKSRIRLSTLSRWELVRRGGAS